MASGPGRFRSLGTATWWQQMRSDGRANLVIAVVVFATAFAVALAPRVIEHASRLDLSETVRTATPEQRNLSFEARRQIGAGAPRDPFFNIDVVSRNLRDDHIPPSVSNVLSSDQWVFDTPEFVVSSFPDQLQGPFPTTIQLRYQSGIEDHLRLVEGALPTAQDDIVRLEGPDCPNESLTKDQIEAFEPLEDQDCSLVELPLFEVAVTQQTADDMMVAIGELLTLLPSATDLSFQSPEVNIQALRFVLRVSGIIELDDEELEYWYADSSLHRPRITENPDFRFVFAVGLMSPDQYRPFRNAARGVDLDFAWRFLVDPELVDRAEASELAADIERIGPPDVQVVTLLPELLNEHLAQRRLTVQLLSMAAVVFAVAAFAAVWTVAIVDAARRRATTELIVDRGASRSQLAAHALQTGVFIASPAVLTGAVAAVLLLRKTSVLPSVLLAVGVGVVTIAIVVVTKLPQRTGREGKRLRLRRLVAEVLLIGLAVAGVVLLRRRATDVASSAANGFDTTLATTPALIALATGVVALRLIGPLAQGLSILANRQRGASWMIGVRRLVDQPRSLRTPILTISIASMVAVFAAVVYSSVADAQEAAAWQTVAGEHRIETANPRLPLPEQVQEAVTSSDGRVAFGSTMRFQRFSGESGDFVADVVALDVAEFQALVENSPLADQVSAALDGVAGAVSESEPLRAVLVGNSEHRERLDESASLMMGRYAIDLQFLSATDHFPGVPSNRQAVLVDRALLTTRTDDRTTAPTVALLGQPGELDDRVRTVVQQQILPPHITSREQRFLALAGDPLSTWTTRSLLWLGVAGLVFAVITSGAAAVLTTTARQRDLGVLAILGHERRSLGRLVAIELLPGITIASILGATAGGAAALLLSDNLSLGAFAIDAGSPSVRLNWWVVLQVVAALAVAVGVTVAVTVRSLRRLDHAMLLRRESQ